MKKTHSHTFKALRNLMLIALMLLLIYHLIGAPVLFPRLRMRMLERQALVGPSTVIDVLAWDEYEEFTKVYVGATNEGFTFFSMMGPWYTTLSYRERTGSITVLPAPTYWENWQNKSTDKHLPIYVFDQFPDAVRAELELKIASDPDDLYYHGEAFDRRYTLEANRETSGYFLFHLHIPCEGETLGTDGYAAQLLSDICHSSNKAVQRRSFEATVRLYSTDGTLITESTQTVRSTAAIANSSAVPERTGT